MLNDSMEHLSQVEESKHEEGTQEAINELGLLMHGHRIGSNSSGNIKISVSLAARIARTAIYGK